MERLSIKRVGIITSVYIILVLAVDETNFVFDAAGYWKRGLTFWADGLKWTNYTMNHNDSHGL